MPRLCNGHRRLVLEIVDGLDDESLHAVIGRAQGLLLDRPAPPGTVPDLSVEIVEGAEREVLVSYRALAPRAQRRLRQALLRLMRVACHHDTPAHAASALPRGAASDAV